MTTRNPKCFFPDCNITKVANPDHTLIRFPKNSTTFLCNRHYPPELLGKRKLKADQYNTIKVILKSQNIEIPFSVNQKPRKTKSVSRRCILKHCDTNNFSIPKLKLFKFPNTDSHLYKKWILNCHLTPELEANITKYLCERHFHPNCFYKKKLKRDSIPLYELSVNDNQSLQSNSNRSIEPMETAALTLPPVPPTKFDITDVIKLEKMDSDDDILIPSTAINSSSNTQNKPIPKLCNHGLRLTTETQQYLRNLPEICTNCMKYQHDLDYLRVENNNLHNNLKNQKHRNQKLSSQIYRLKYRYKQALAKNKAIKEQLNICDMIDRFDHVDENAKIFAKILLQKRTGGYNYSIEQRNLAQNIYYKSPATYTFLRNRFNFNLPSVSSISRWAPMKQLNSGFDQSIMNALRQKISQLNDRSKHVSLINDTMSIRPDIIYNEILDKIIGYQDYAMDVDDDDDDDGNKGGELKIAKYIALFIVRSDFDEWKSILSFFPIHTIMSSEKVKEIIIRNIDVAESLGLTVSCVICNHSPNNRIAYQRLCVTIDQPYIKNNNENSTRKCYALYDFNHLIRSALYYLFKNNIKTSNGVASWSVLTELYDFENSANLTDPNVTSKTLEKLLNDNSISECIRSAADNQQFSKRTQKFAYPTAYFLDILNRLYQCLNSTIETDSDKPYRSALIKDNLVYRFLCDTVKYLSEIKVAEKNFWQDDLSQTLNALIMLSNYYYENPMLNIRYMITSRKNNDNVRKFFNIIRSHYGLNRNPSVQELLHIMSRILSMKLLHNNDTTNNENVDNDRDNDNGYLSLITPETAQETYPSTVYDTSYKFENFITDIEMEPSTMSNITKNYSDSKDEDIEFLSNFALREISIKYYAGQVAYRLIKKLKKDSSIDCICLNSLKNKSTDFQEATELLTLHRKYFNESDLTKYVLPSDIFFKICKFHCLIFINFMTINAASNKLCKSIEKLCINGSQSHKDPDIKNWFNNHICRQHHLEALNVFTIILLRKYCAWKIARFKTIDQIPCKKRLRKKTHKIIDSTDGGGGDAETSDPCTDEEGDSVRNLIITDDIKYDKEVAGTTSFKDDNAIDVDSKDDLNIL